MLSEIVQYADGCLVGDQPELQSPNGDVVKDSAPRSLSVPAKRQITSLREKPIVIAAAALRARALVLGRSNSRGASHLPGNGWKSHCCVFGRDGDSSDCIPKLDKPLVDGGTGGHSIVPT
jgi:hypothetical protein